MNVVLTEYGITLIDGDARRADHPDTFAMPSVPERMAVQVGDFVKLGFEINASGINGERMWVRVTEAAGGYFEGVLRNNPVIVPISFGDPVMFRCRHILDILKQENAVKETTP